MHSFNDQAYPPPRDNFNTSRTEETTNTWLTPPSLIHSLGELDLDPVIVRLKRDVRLDGEGFELSREHAVFALMTLMMMSIR